MNRSLPHLQEAAERLADWLPDVCQIREPDGEPTRSDVYPFTVEPTPGPVTYSGRCFVQGIAAPTGSGHISGENLLTETHRLRLPRTVALPTIGSIVTVTESETDCTLEGREFVVADTSSDSALVSRQVALRSIERTSRVD